MIMAFLVIYGTKNDGTKNNSMKHNGHKKLSIFKSKTMP
jgi:hypothetical protein